LYLDKKISKKNIVAWQSNSGWFYLTIFNSTADSSELMRIDLPNGVKSFQIEPSLQSTNIGLRLNNPISHHTISDNGINEIITISMHYPNLFLSEYIENNPSLGTVITPKVSASYKDWMYISGFIFTLNGLLSQSQNKTNRQTITGLVLLISTFIADKLFNN
tara:strand:+ start:31357 stop:31842 length:486 start_codon:yes stop_codon:yes gene_type:complete